MSTGASRWGGAPRLYAAGAKKISAITKKISALLVEPLRTYYVRSYRQRNQLAGGTDENDQAITNLKHVTSHRLCYDSSTWGILCCREWRKSEGSKMTRKDKELAAAINAMIERHRRYGTNPKDWPKTKEAK